MSIDWFTFIAQLINFLILVWLMKKFLYKPILKTIDEREKRISGQLQEAATLKKEASAELENFQQKNNEFDQHRQELFNSARIEADSERQKLLEQTREEVERLRLQLKETIRNEQQSLSSEIKQRTQAEVFSIVRKTLSDLASVSLEDKMTDLFINRIKNIDPKEKELILSEITNIQAKVVVRCAFELTPVQHSSIEDILKKDFFLKTKVKFDTAPDLVSGIELIAGGYKLIWSIDDYLLSLEEGIGEILSSKP
jgi:F-type H+-transporting ATPase subunit b